MYMKLYSDFIWNSKVLGDVGTENAFVLAYDSYYYEILEVIVNILRAKLSEMED